MSGGRGMGGVDDRVWQSIMLNIGKLKKRSVTVGVLHDAEVEGGGSLIAVAAIHEFGEPAMNIPERSYLRSTFAEHAVVELRQVTKKLAEGIIRKRVTVEQGLGMLGAWAAGAVRRSITEKKIVQNLKPATIARKGSSTALIDTSQLKNAITWEVE